MTDENEASPPNDAPSGESNEPTGSPSPIGGRRRRLISEFLLGVGIMVLVALLLVVFRGGDDDANAPSTTSKKPVPTTSAAAIASAVSVPAGAGPTAYLRDVRIFEGTSSGAADNTTPERVEFVFDGPLPGYKVAYVPGAQINDAAGDPVRVSVDHAVEVRMDPASEVDRRSPEPSVVYNGPRVVRGVDGKVVEVISVGENGSALTWLIGLAEKIPFTVTAEQNPARLVVEFAG